MRTIATAPLFLPILLAFSSLAVAAETKPAPAATAAPTAVVPPSKPSETNPKGYPPPDSKNFKKVADQTTDASPAIEGKETRVETWESANKDRVMKLSTNDVVWAFGYLPGGDPMKGYVLRDPNCEKKLTEKWAPNAPFSAPDCAVNAKPKK